MHQKYQNGLPLNRQEEDWKRLGVPLSRATLANWIIYCAENYLRHVYDYFHRQLRMRKYLMADETRVPGHCSLSNNLSENVIRPFTIGRKNWLFSTSPKGATASAIVYTMVEMAKSE